MGKEVRRELKIIPAQVEVVEHVQFIYSCRNCEKTADHISIVKGTPIYRQEQDYKRNGIELSRQTMSNWVNRSSLDWLETIYEALKKELLKREVLCADETTLQVLREPGKTATSKSYMWLYRTGLDGTHKHVDGYQAYHKLLSVKVIVISCLI